jgi:HEAT repeat protein
MVKKAGSRLVEVRLVASLALALAFVSVVALMISQAQASYVPGKVSSVLAQPSANGTVVSVAAEGPLNRAQNWHDSEGYHLVFPNTVPADSLKLAGGVRVRRIGTSLEVLLQTKPGSRVSLQPDGNYLYLVVDRKLEARLLDGDSRYEPSSAEEQQLFRDPQSRQTQLDSASSNLRSSSGETAHTAGNWSPPIGPMSDLPPEPFPSQTTAGNAASQIEVQPEDEGLWASIFSGTSVFLVMVLGLFGLIVSRKLRSRQPIETKADPSLPGEVGWEDLATEGTGFETRGSQKGGPGSSLVKSGGSGAANGTRQSVVRMPVAGPTSLYGAYRIDQEVGKLILGEPHRMDVLASRAIDDRRAIETSLIKGLKSFDLDESGRRRARAALEEYGFVARQCAALLLSPDPFDRTSAARCLGEIKSETALPFLLEGLYDSESIVRNQAVVSIGELKLPSAIGALLDIARIHSDVPSALLSRTLSACSVDGLEFFGAMIQEASQLGMGHDISMIEQITHLEPCSSVEELPESCDDEQLAPALLSSESSDVQERAEALTTLAQFRVQSSVRAIAQVARQDSEPNIRSMAIASLGSIDHESVFPAILIGMADATREVRASAARALNRLSFDRADAYVRVIETSDEETLREVAQACIQAGIVSQNLDRLDSSDHRQAYEMFSLICLLAKANMNEPILDAIADHSNLDVSLRAVHLLASTGQPEAFEQLRQLAVREGVREIVKTALLEAIYKLDQAKALGEESVESTGVDSEPKSETSETVEAQVGSGSQFESIPTSQFESKPESEVGVELKLDELEL